MKYRLGRTRNGGRGSVDMNQMSNDALVKLVEGTQLPKFKRHAKRLLDQRGVSYAEVH